MTSPKSTGKRKDRHPLFGHAELVDVPKQARQAKSRIEPLMQFRTLQRFQGRDLTIRFALAELSVCVDSKSRSIFGIDGHSADGDHSWESRQFLP